LSSSSPLPLRVRAKPHETPASLLDRLAARHGDVDPAAFGRSFGVDRTALSFGRGVSRLLSLAGFAPDAPRLCVARPDARTRTVALGSGIVALGDWGAHGGRYCPACVAEDRRTARDAGRIPEAETHRRFWWDLGSLAHCPAHGLELRAACPSCGCPAAWGGMPGRCRACLAVLGRVPATAVEASPFSVYLHARLLGASTDMALLDTLSVKDVVGQVARMGMTAAAPPGRFKPRDGNVDLHAMRSAGFAIFEAWPGAFYQALDRHLRAEVKPLAHTAGMIAAYGWVYEHWIEPLDPATSFGRSLRSTLRHHAVGNGVIPETDPVLNEGRPGNRTTLTEAARILGWGFERTRREAGRHGQVPIGARRGVGIRVDLEKLRQQEPGAGGMSLTRLGSRLGIGKVQAGRLVASGLLGSPGRHDRRVATPDECDAFISKVIAGLPRLSVLTPGASTLSAACRSRQIPIETACRLILAGVLRPLGVVGPAPKLSDIAVLPDTLPRPPRPGEALASIEDAARALRLHHETVRHLAGRGLIRKVGRGRKGGMSQDEIRAFRHAHLSGTEAAERMGTSPRSAARRLLSAGIGPVAAPPRCRQYVFRREDVERVLEQKRT
jgi:hypothetical protein